MKRVYLFLVIFLSFLVLNSQETQEIGSTIISNEGNFEVSNYETQISLPYFDGVVNSSLHGKLYYIFDAKNYIIYFFNKTGEIIDISFITRDFTIDHGLIFDYDISEKIIDNDNKFELILNHNNRVLIIDNDGTILLEIEDFSVNIINDDLNYYLVTKKVGHIVKLNTVEKNPIVYDTIRVVSYDTVNVFSYDTVTYLKTEYLSIYDELVIYSSDFTNIVNTRKENEPSVVVYPNPTTSSVNIECDYEFNDYLISIVNPEGKVLFKEKIINGDVIRINIAELGFSKGLHIIYLESPEGDIVTKKLLVN